MNRGGSIAAFGFGLVLALSASTATAGGMFLPTRGVRATARGGAWVAGADDLSALSLNPAGIAHLLGEQDKQFFFDVSYVAQQVHYTRIDSGFNPQEEVDSESGGQPIPGLGLAVDLTEDLVVAGGLYAPYAALGRFPEQGPQRYSLVDLSRSVVAVAEVAVAWRVNDRLRLGAGLQNMFSNIVSRIVLSGCPGQTVCAPEDGEFDALAEVAQTDYFSPSAILGAQYDFSPRIRGGLAVQLPFSISGSGTVRVALPSSGFFDDARVTGDRASVSFMVPAMIRAGIEVQPHERWRAEVDVDLELWSMHDEFRVDIRDVRIENAPGVDAYEVGDIVVPREFDNTVALSAGIEGQPLASIPLTVAAGWTYETGAPPDEYLSVVTVDGAKQIWAGGLGYRFGRHRLYASASYAAIAEREVSPEEGRAPQLTPVRPSQSPDAPEVFVNWGSYRARWVTAGVGLVSEF